MNKTTKNILQIALTIVIVVVSLGFALRDIDFDKFYAALSDVNYIWAIVPLPIIILSHYIRSLRWRTILKPVFEAKSTLNLFSAVMVGYFFNSIFTRLGEFVRPYVYAKREKISASSAFATIVVERVIDVFTLGFLLGIAFILSSDKIQRMMPGVDPMKVIIFSIFVFIVLFLSFYPPFVTNSLRIIVKPLSKKIYDRLNDIYFKFRKGFSVIKRPSLYFRLVVESLFIWLCYALPMYIMIFCFDFNQSIDVNLSDALFLVIVSGIGVTIAPTPSGIGVMHFLIKYAMVGLYGIPEEQAFAYATINHAASFLIQLSVGSVFVFRERVTKLPTSGDVGIEDGPDEGKFQSESA